MDRETFVKKIKEVLLDQSMDELINFYQSPPGRKPREKIVEISNFFNELNQHDQSMIKKIISDTIQSTIFGFLCILDHVRFLEDTNKKSTIKLYINDGEKDTLINDANDEPLHDIFNGSVGCD